MLKCFRRMGTIFVVLAITLMLSVTFVSCKTAAEEPAAEQTAAEQTAAEQTAAEQPAAEEPAAEETAAKGGISAVRYINQETLPATVAVQRKWIEKFKAEYPNYDVILEAAPASVINQTVATYLQAGAPLDAIMSDGGSAARLAVEGMLAPLDDIVEKLGGREAFLPGKLLIYEDKVYAINQTAAYPVLHYRTDIFEDLGLVPPGNWDQLLEAATRITEEVDGVYGISLPGGENRATTIISGIYLWQAGGNFFNKDLEVTLDNERTAEALEFYAKLLAQASPDASGWDFFQPIEAFFSGRSAMVLAWHALDLTYANNPDLMDVVSAVQATEGHMRVTEIGGRYNLVFANSENLEASKAWIEFMYRSENLMELVEVQPQFWGPLTKDGLEELRQSEAPTMQTYGDLLFDVVYASGGIGYNQIFHAGGINPETKKVEETWIVNPYVSVLWNSNIYARAVQQVAYNNVSGAEAAAEAQIALEEQIESGK